MLTDSLDLVDLVRFRKALKKNVFLTFFTLLNKFISLQSYNYVSILQTSVKTLEPLYAQKLFLHPYRSNKPL